MMWARLLFLAATLAVMAPAQAEYAVDCEGYDDETSAMVEGRCTDGSFTGENAETGEDVSGSCEFGGDLSATNDETGSSVSGDCQGE